jgi:hypothetical protein
MKGYKDYLVHLQVLQGTVDFLRRFRRGSLFGGEKEALAVTFGPVSNVEFGFHVTGSHIHMIHPAGERQLQGGISHYLSNPRKGCCANEETGFQVTAVSKNLY